MSEYSFHSAPVGYAHFIDRGDYDPDEQFNPDHYCAPITFKPFVGKNEPPIHRAERQHLPAGHPDKLSFEERCYGFFRDYRVDVERGRIACNNKEYKYACAYEQYYLGLTQGIYERVPMDEDFEDWSCGRCRVVKDRRELLRRLQGALKLAKEYDRECGGR